MAYIAQPAGFLEDTVQRIYDYSNEPSTNPKWTTDKLFPLIRGSYARIMADVNGIGQNPIVVRFNITVTTTQRTYLLPPNVGQVLMFGKVDPANGEFYERIIPNSRFNPAGSGCTFEGPLVRLSPLWQENDTLQILYIPNGDCVMHVGTFAQNATGVSTTTFPLAVSPSEGYFDRRPNAYLGSVARLLSAVSAAGVASTPSGYSYFPIQERPITSYAPTTQLATVDTAFDFNPGDASTMSGTDPAVITYEVVPFMGDFFQEAIAWDVAALVNGTERRYAEKKDCLQNRLNQMRLIRNNITTYNSRTGMIARADIFGYGNWGWTV